MNLIGNCCISNFLLRHWGFGNTNPFNWIDLDFSSFYNLLTGYEMINWAALSISCKQHPYWPPYKVFELTIDKKVKLTFIHVLHFPNYPQPVIKGGNVYCDRPWEYIVQKYSKRVKRMLDANQPPMFVHEWEHLDYNESAFQKLLDADLKYKVVAITNNQKLKDVKKENLLVIYDPSGKGPGPENHLPGWFANTYKDVIKDFLKS